MTKQADAARANGPKYRYVFERLLHDISTGKYAAGQRLPSEAALVRLFGASRITVGRAVRELKQRGLVERIPGSGTYVRSQPPSTVGAVLGLLIPELGTTEIFEPICQGMAAAPEASKNALLWGRTESTQVGQEAQALKLCQEYIERGVAGVFFAPLEFTPSAMQTNAAILAALDNAHIPVVLLDRDIMPFPQRTSHDLVGIDNRRAGYLATEHLLKLKMRNILFFRYKHCASTVDARIAGFREAMLRYGVPLKTSSVQRASSLSESFVSRIMKIVHPDAFVCANDRTAGDLMHALIRLGYKVPRDVRIVGIDDVNYAQLLPVPLTTITQPGRQIGEAAMAAMCQRIERPDLPAREILLDCALVVRDSSGVSASRKRC